MKLNPIACSFELSQPNGHIQLFPFGRFFPADGRPEGQGGWYVDDSNGVELAQAINQLNIDLMIDYEHQTIYLEQNGKPNPAAGWIKRAEYISGEGLFADVEWTDIAAEQIKSKQYRYISPLFLAAPDGRVVKVLNAALTNRPALHNLAEAFAASQQFNQPNQEDNSMLDLLRNLFALPNGSEDEIKQKLTALSAAKGDSPVALSDVYTKLAEQETQVVALAAQANKTPDPAKYVPLSDMQAVQNQLNSLQAQITKDKVDGLIETALSEGRLLPAQKQWAQNLGNSNFQALSDYLATVSPTAALAGDKQAKGDPNANQPVALSDAEKAAARMLGMSEAEFIKTHKESN